MLGSRPAAYPQILIGLDFAIGPVKEIVIAGEPEDPRTKALLREVRKRFLPSTVIALRPSGEAGEGIVALVPFLKEQIAQGGKPTAYVCENYACKLPVHDPDKLAPLL